MSSMMRQNKKKIVKILISILAALLLACLYTAIFGFSSQDGETSGSLSQFITEKCVEIINSLSGRHWTEAMMKGMAEYFEHPVRKLAHFSEYAVMGILVYMLWRPWMHRGKKLYLLAVVWVLLSAAGDELHQLFVPGRCGNIWDVLLDTGGGAFGALLCAMTEQWVERSRRHKKKKA